MSTRPVIAACMLLALVACNRAPKPAPAIPYAAPGVHFALAPIAGDCTRATVSWEIPDSMPEKIEVQIDRNARTVFTRSNDRKGHEDTGPWVRQGLEFYLLDRKSGDVIATTRAPAGYCAGLPGR